MAKLLPIFVRTWELANHGRPYMATHSHVKTKSRKKVPTHLLLQLHRIESEVLVQDTKLIVHSPVLIEQQLRKEGEILAVPCVLCIACTEGDAVREIEMISSVAEYGIAAVRTHMHIKVPK